MKSFFWAHFVENKMISKITSTKKKLEKEIVFDLFSKVTLHA